MKMLYLWNLLGLGVLLHTSQAFAVTSTYSGESCRGDRGPIDVARAHSLVRPAAVDHFGAGGVICPIIRNLDETLTSVSVLVETGVTCTLGFGDPSESAVYSASPGAVTDYGSLGDYTELSFDVTTFYSSFVAYGYDYIHCAGGGVFGYSVDES